MRKKLLFVTVTIVFSIQLVAQVKPKQLYPAFTYGRNVFDYNTNTFQPSFSVGLNEHVTLGMFYKHTRYNDLPAALPNSYSTRNGAGINYRYYHYFGKRSKLGWYLDGELALYQVNVFNKSGNTNVLNNRYTELQFKVTPGLFYSFSPKVMLFANFGGLSLDNGGYGLRLNKYDLLNQVNIGLRFSLGGSRKNKR